MSNFTRELITLQVGHYANFVGTHWWNLQEASFVYNTATPTDINHDFLFRDGLTPQRQETYTPRLLAIDLKGSLNTLPAHGTLYSDLGEPSTSEASWDGHIQLIQQLPQEKNDFLKDLEQEDARFRGIADEDKDICIDDSKISEADTGSSKKIYDLTTSVQVWSDFLRPHLHPNSIHLIDNLLLNVGRAAGESSDNTWGFSSGQSVFQREEVEEEITNRIRCLAESCSSLQGFQVLSDIHDGMGGISCGVLQHLADEYSSKDSITFATSPPHLTPSTEPARMLMQSSIVQSYAALCQLSSVVVPLNMRKSVLDFETPHWTLQHLAVKDYNAYITSSIMAAFLDTVSVAYRSRTLPLPIANVVDILTPARRKVAGGSLAFPLGIGSDQSFSEWLHQEQESPFVSLSGEGDFSVEPVSELLTIRGIPAARLNRPDTKMSGGRFFASADELYKDVLQKSQKPPSLRYVASVVDPVKTTSPFPNIFARSVTDSGYINTYQKTPVEGVSSVPCLAGLHQGKGLANFFQQLLAAAKKIDVMKVPLLLEEGVDKEGWAGMTEDLQEMSYAYCGNSEGMNSDDDT